MSNDWKTILAIDLDQWAAETFRANFPVTKVICGKVSDHINGLPDADVLIGGPPCQPFSLAGVGAGELDERDCIPDFVAAVRKVRPRQFLMENVPGLMSEKHIHVLARTMRAMERLGYVVQTRILDAVKFGVPQFRNRVWVWGISNKHAVATGAGHCWPRPTHTWPAPDECMFGAALLPAVTVGQALGLSNSGFQVIGGVSHPHFAGDVRAERYITDEPSTTMPATGDCHGNALPKVHEYLWSDAMLQKHPPASPAPAVQAKYANSIKLCADGRTWDELRPCATAEKPAPTVRARSPRDGGRCTEQVVRDKQMVRRLTPLECLRLQSAPDDFRWPEKIPKTAMYRIVGNGVACRMAWHFSQAFRRVDPPARSVISLFCGGGLMDCGWHGRFWEWRHDVIPLCNKCHSEEG